MISFAASGRHQRMSDYDHAFVLIQGVKLVITKLVAIRFRCWNRSGRLRHYRRIGSFTRNVAFQGGRDFVK
jgi:hypothetical protein